MQVLQLTSTMNTPHGTWSQGNICPSGCPWLRLDATKSNFFFPLVFNFGLMIRTWTLHYRYLKIYVLFYIYFLVFSFTCSLVCIEMKTKKIWWKYIGYIRLTRPLKDWVSTIGFAWIRSTQLIATCTLIILLKSWSL